KEDNKAAVRKKIPPKPAMQLRSMAPPPPAPREAYAPPAEAVRGEEKPKDVEKQAQAAREVASLADRLRQSNAQVVVEGYADTSDGDKNAASLGRANRAREQLIRAGIAPDRIAAVGKGVEPGRAAGVRVIETKAQSPLAAGGFGPSGGDDG